MRISYSLLPTAGKNKKVLKIEYVITVPKAGVYNLCSAEQNVTRIAILLDPRAFQKLVKISRLQSIQSLSS